MAYSDFSLTRFRKAFQLQEKTLPLFPEAQTLTPSSWLQETLDTSVKLALSSSTEKARSEFIIAPVLLETQKRNQQQMRVFSGERLDIDEEKGLKGECDFLFSSSADALSLKAPIFSLVEAKKNDIKEGLGQCAAQMLGAALYNQAENIVLPHIYGCVTTGEDWQFLKLSNSHLYLDTQRYYLNELNKILWILQFIVDSAQSARNT